MHPHIGLNFTKLYGIPVDDICGANWTFEDFSRLKLRGTAHQHPPVLVHFNGDSKVPLMARCLNIHPRMAEGLAPVLTVKSKSLRD